MNKKDIKNIRPEELKKLFISEKFEAYRAQQVIDWVWKKRVHSFELMKNIPLSLKRFLEKRYFLRSGRVKKKITSSDKTVKFLIRFPENTCVETVFLTSSHHNTICISSQAGCAMGCSFCATGMGGFQRDLLSGEIIEQILVAEEETGEKVGNVVIMGMGEPFANYDNVIHAIRVINAPYALKIGARRITLSTVGIPDAIRRFAHEKDLQVRLSVSLHAPDNALRTKLVPVNKKYSIEDVLKACMYYSEKAKKYVSFEYLLIKGVNDLKVHADLLAKRLKNWKARVNIIPYNPVFLLAYQRPEKKDIKDFVNVLKGKGINATVRKERGADIDAACGQLKIRGKKKIHHREHPPSADFQHVHREEKEKVRSRK